MSEFWLVNTNNTYRPKTKHYMLKNRCICAQYAPKEEIDSISDGDIVFIYENRVGIIAHGVANGIVIVCDYKRKRDEQHKMALRSFRRLRHPVTPSEIIGTSYRLDDVGVYFARTVVPLRMLTGTELHRLCKKRSI